MIHFKKIYLINEEMISRSTGNAALAHSDARCRSLKGVTKFKSLRRPFLKFARLSAIRESCSDGPDNCPLSD